MKYLKAMLVAFLFLLSSSVLAATTQITVECSSVEEMQKGLIAFKAKKVAQELSVSTDGSVLIESVYIYKREKGSAVLVIRTHEKSKVSCVIADIAQGEVI